MPPELVKEHLVFSEQKVGEQMTNTMPKADAGKWFGTAPPDLTLIARLRGEDWLYTYLRSFYKDESRPWGVNNVVFKDVGMPNVLEYLQGEQVTHCTPEELLHQETKIDPLTGVEVGGCFSIAEGTGQQTPREFDRTIYDLVNFLVYVGEPSKARLPPHWHLRASVPVPVLLPGLRAEEGVLAGYPLKDQEIN